MYEYIAIDAVLTRIPQALKEEESDSTLIKWALDCYLQNEKDINNKLETKFAICTVVDHVASLPVGFKKLYEARYSLNPISSTLTDTNSFMTTYADTIDGRHVIIFQGLVYQGYQHESMLMRYTGQDMDIVDNGCLNLLCDTCQINFSIDRFFKTISTSSLEGYVALLYKGVIKDEDGNFVIPKDDTLLDALGAYCVAQHYLDASVRREGGAYEMYQQHITRCNNLYGEWTARNMYRKYDANRHVWNTQTNIKLPGIIYQNNRIND